MSKAKKKSKPKSSTKGRTTPKGTKPQERATTKRHAPVLVNRRKMADRGIIMGPSAEGAACSCGWMTAIGSDTTVFVCGAPGDVERVTTATARDKAIAALKDHLDANSGSRGGSDVSSEDGSPTLAPPRGSSSYFCECGWTPPAGMSDIDALRLFEQHRDGLEAAS